MIAGGLLAPTVQGAVENFDHTKTGQLFISRPAGSAVQMISKSFVSQCQMAVNRGGKSTLIKASKNSASSALTIKESVVFSHGF